MACFAHCCTQNSCLLLLARQNSARGAIFILKGTHQLNIKSGSPGHMMLGPLV
jgi:hypothetical protein